MSNLNSFAASRQAGSRWTPWVLMAALALSGCATTATTGQPEASAVPTMTKVEQSLETHAARISRAWAELADLERNLGQREAARAVPSLATPVKAFVFQGDVEEFLPFFVQGTAWRIGPPEGLKPGTASLVYLKVPEGRSMQEVLKDAADQVSGVAEIVVTPSANTIRVRYSGLNR